jgi:ribose transport system permease protein
LKSDPYVLILLIGLLVIVGVFSIASPVFATPGNATNLAQEMAISGIVAIGMAIVLICGDVDLSVGAIGGFAGIIAVQFQGLGSAPAIVIAIVCATLVGLVQGLVIVWTRVHSLIVTLATMTLLRGVVLVMTGGFPQPWNANGVASFLWGRSLIPPPFILFIIVAVVVFLMLSWTRLGISFYAAGGNSQSASQAGISVPRVRVIALSISGFLSGVGGVMLMTRLQNASPTGGTGWELAAISAVVIGGVSLLGGRGSMSGVVIGILLLTVIANGMNLLGISSYFQQIVQGALIVIATGVSSLRSRTK